jgi:hypothetical protein
MHATPAHQRAKLGANPRPGRAPATEIPSASARRSPPENAPKLGTARADRVTPVTRSDDDPVLEVDLAECWAPGQLPPTMRAAWARLVATARARQRLASASAPVQPTLDPSAPTDAPAEP